MARWIRAMGLTSHHSSYVSARIINYVRLRVGVVILHALVLVGTDKDKAAAAAHISTEVMTLQYNLTAHTTSTGIGSDALCVLGP